MRLSFAYFLRVHSRLRVIDESYEEMNMREMANASD